jgi:hypothetical protein
MHAPCIYICVLQRHLGWCDISLHFLALLWNTSASWVVPIPSYWLLYLEIELFFFALLLIIIFEWNCSGLSVALCIILWHIVPLLGKVLETHSETTAIAMQQHGKHASTTIELLLEMVFSMWSMPRSYLEDNWVTQLELFIPCGGRF